MITHGVVGTHTLLLAVTAVAPFRTTWKKTRKTTKKI
jgi:hypothetical protein